MFTKDILFGMNILTPAGFAVMGITLTLNRMGQAGKALSIGLMTGFGIRRAICRRRALNENQLPSRGALPWSLSLTHGCT